MKLERVQKLIAQGGLMSRRHAEELITSGKVKVNGKVIKLGDKASFEDDIIVSGKMIAKVALVYYLMNKPTQTITSLAHQDNRQIVTDLIADKTYMFPVGRLDYMTTGTLLLTNDGELAYRLMHPKYEIIRVYRARIDRPLTPVELKWLNSNQVMIDGHQSLQSVDKVDTKSYVVVLKQGLNHHVKKLFELVGTEVLTLTRLEFAGITHVGDVERGKYRRLKHHEVVRLKKLVNLL